MEKKITIRENTAEYMQELREWAGEAGKGGLEEMAAFFRNRLGEYEEHMSMWNAVRSPKSLLHQRSSDT